MKSILKIYLVDQLSPLIRKDKRMDSLSYALEQMMINNRLVTLRKELNYCGRLYGLTEEEVEDLTMLIEETLHD